MKINLKKNFGFMVGTVEVKYPLGVLRIPQDITEEVASAAVRMGVASWVVEKVAPENKAVAVAENKSGLERPVRRRRKRAEPEASAED